MKKVKLVILGIPQPKQSVRSGVVYGRDGKPVTFVDQNTGKEKVIQKKFQPKEIIQHEQSIKFDVISQLPVWFKPFKGPVRINKLHFVFPPLKSLSKKKLKSIDDGMIIYKDKKPDLMDNLNKGLLDVLEGVVYLNDSQIVEANNIKKYYGNKPRIEIELEDLEQ